MLLTLAAAALAGAAPEPPRPRIHPSLHRRTVFLAMRAPERPRTADEAPRLCVADMFSASEAPRRVCRSREDWNSLGLEPITD